MPYALFCDEAKLSKAYPTEADVWERARQCGLLVDVTSNEPTPRSVFENDYEIRPCPPDSPEHLADKQAETGWEAELDLLPYWGDGDGGQVIATNASALRPPAAIAWKRVMAMRVLAVARAAWDSSKPHFIRPA